MRMSCIGSESAKYCSKIDITDVWYAGGHPFEKDMPRKQGFAGELTSTPVGGCSRDGRSRVVNSCRFLFHNYAKKVL